MSFNKHYQQELQKLKELGVEFSKAHPALAPMLSGQTPDPDVERLLEGTAFLTGLLRQKLEDEFPEIVHGLMGLIFPHYLRPLPSATMMAFAPKPSLREILAVPAGVQIGSLPVDGTACLFKTCYGLELHPLRVAEAALVEKPGKPAQIRIRMELTGMPLAHWRPERIRLHIGGDYPAAADLYLILNRCVQRILIEPTGGGRPLQLPAGALVPAGFAPGENLIPYPGQAFPGYRLLQEYFILPQKFLFFDLTGLELWQDRGDGPGFEIVFELSKLPIATPQIRTEQFMLFVTPAVNLFPHEADPILIDHRQPEYRIRPSGYQNGNYEIYSVDQVTGLMQGSVEHREYLPFEIFAHRDGQNPVYAETRRNSPVGQRQDVFLALTYPAEADLFTRETLSIALTCTNGSLPERLQLGDISQPTSTSPELTTFRNILAPTAPNLPPIGGNLQWHFLSHLALNYLSLADRNNLQELLSLYVFPEGRDKTRIAANCKRIEGIADLKVRAADRLVRGYVMRGREIRMRLSQDHFASPGDMFLFGTVMDYLFSVFSSINAFTHLKVEETITGETYTWPPRIGERRLI